MIKLEGQLDIELVRDASGIRQATVRSDRPLQASRVLEGISVEEALQRLPRIFSLCGTAQAVTAVSACEQALAITPSIAHKQAREMLVWMENAREHLLRILLDWPGFAEEEVEQEGLPELMQLLPELSKALFANSAPFNLGSTLTIDYDAAQRVITKLRDLISKIIGTKLPVSRDCFGTWLQKGETLPARLLCQLRDRGWDKLGNVESTFIPPLETTELHQRFSEDEADTFLAEPVWQGLPCETTPLQRQQLQPLIKKLLESEGNGLMTRLTARLTELMLIPDLLHLGLKRLVSAPKATSSRATDSGVGLAQAEAARGRLIHRVEIENNVVKRYQILAPTEWNFHPQGIALKGLCTLNASDEDSLRKQAMLWLNAIDPCVGYNLQVSGNA